MNLIYRANAGNGKPAIEFDGSTSYGRSPSFVIAQPLTVFLVAKAITWVSPTRFYDGNTVNKVDLEQVSVATKFQPISMQATATQNPKDDTMDVGFVTLIEAFYNGASSTIKVNENNSLTGDPSTLGFSDGMIFGTAGGLNAGFFCNYQLLECIVCDSTLTASQKNLIRVYLNRKHGFTTRNLLICDGNSLTSGTGSTGGLDYVTQLQTLLGGSSVYRKVNKGVAAQTTQQMSADAATDIDPNRDNWARPILVAWEVGNDIFNNSLSGAAAEANFNTYCTNRRAAGFKVVAVTVPARVAGPPAANIAAANTLIRANWTGYADALADVAADARLTDYTNLTYYDPDQTHLNNTGYGVVAGIVKTAVLSIP